MEVDTDGETVNDVRIYGGCRGQGGALARFIVGMKLVDAIPKLRGVECRGGTSCADQLGRILEQELELIRSRGKVILPDPAAKKKRTKRWK
jgi:uncharacterized protein (TIGR03905 family)